MMRPNDDIWQVLPQDILVKVLIYSDRPDTWIVDKKIILQVSNQPELRAQVCEQTLHSVLHESCDRNDLNMIAGIRLYAELVRPNNIVPNSELLFRVITKRLPRVMELLLQWPTDPAPHNSLLLDYAVSIGSVELVKTILLHQQTPPRADFNDGKLLITACSNGDMEIAKHLVCARYPARANCQSGASLIAAIKSASVEIVEMLISAPKDRVVPTRNHLLNASRPLSFRIIKGSNFRERHLKVLQLIIGAMHDADALSVEDLELAFVYAARKGCLHVIKYILSLDLPIAPRADCMDGQALINACKNEDEKMVKFLLSLEHPPKADIRNNLALKYACKYGNIPIARLLLTARLHPAKPDKSINNICDRYLQGKLYNNMLMLLLSRGS